jgi:hypothetical protein
MPKIIQNLLSLLTLLKLGKRLRVKPPELSLSDDLWHRFVKVRCSSRIGGAAAEKLCGIKLVIRNCGVILELKEFVMKRWILSCLVMPFLFAACGGNKSDSGNSTTTIATVPPPSQCMDGTTYCNANMYGQNYGYQAYPYNPYYYGFNGYYGGGQYANFCDCPGGSRPVFNGQYGLGCVNSSAFGPYASGAVYWGWGANNNQWVNWPSRSNTQPIANAACYGNVAQSCIVGQANTCGTGAACQPTSGASRVGICVRQ